MNQHNGDDAPQKRVKYDLLGCLTLQDGMYRLFRNVGYHQSTPRNITEELRSHLHCGSGLKSRKVILYLWAPTIPALHIHYPMGLLGKRHTEDGDRFCLRNLMPYALFISNAINNKDRECTGIFITANNRSHKLTGISSAINNTAYDCTGISNSATNRVQDLAEYPTQLITKTMSVPEYLSPLTTEATN